MPKDTEPLLKTSDVQTEKSSNIFSENYDAEADVLQSMNSSEQENDLNEKLLGFINKLFNSEN